MCQLFLSENLKHSKRLIFVRSLDSFRFWPYAKKTVVLDMYYILRELNFKPVERTGHPPGYSDTFEWLPLLEFFYFLFFWCDSWAFGRRWSRSFLSVKTSSTPPEWIRAVLRRDILSGWHLYRPLPVRRLRSLWERRMAIGRICTVWSCTADNMSVGQIRLLFCAGCCFFVYYVVIYFFILYIVEN